MSPTLFALIILALYFIFIGWRKREIGDEEKRTASFFETVASLFTVVGAGEYALGISLVAVYGFVGPSLFLGLGGALFAISMVSKRVREIALDENSAKTICDGFSNFTTPDLFYMKNGRSVSIVSSAITALAFIGILWLQLILGGQLLAGLAGIDYMWGVIFLGIVVAVYVTLGRFSAILHTDSYQGLFMWFTLYLVIGYIYFCDNNNVSLCSILSEIANVSNRGLEKIFFDPTAVTIFLSTVIAAFAGPDLWQRVVMAPSDKAAKQGTQLAGVMMILFILPILMLSVHIYLHVGIDSADPFVEYTSMLSKSVFLLPVWLKILFAMGLLSAFLSTADTSVMLVATTMMNEFGRESKNNIINIKKLQLIVVIVVVLGMILAVTIKSASLLFTGVLSMLAAQGLPFFFGIFNRGNKIIVLFALITGSLLALALTFIWPDYNQGYWLLLPFLPGILCVFGKPENSCEG